MTAPRILILALVCALALPAIPASARNKVTGAQQQDAASGQKKPAPAAPAASLPDPAAHALPDIKWPAPTLGADETFAKREGAHFENMFETWQVSGFLEDGAGRPLDFTVLFSKTGPVMMLLRHGFASLNGPDGYQFVSFAPENVRRAAEEELKQLLQADPGNKAIEERIAILQSGQSQEFFVIGDEARVLRNSLAINYGPFTLNRVDEKQLLWKLTADIHGRALDLNLAGFRDPIQFYQPYIKVGSRGSLDGYVFPVVAAEGAITDPGGESAVRGHAIMTHLWGAVDAAGFRRYTIIGMNFDNGLFLQTFRFYSPQGVIVNEYTVVQEPLAEPRLAPEFSLEETGSWTSGLSGIKYPEKWAVSGAGFEGELTLDGREHEMSIAGGRGAFYLGPCSYSGTIPGKKGEARGRGFCRLVAPQP